MSTVTLICPLAGAVNLNHTLNLGPLLFQLLPAFKSGVPFTVVYTASGEHVFIKPVTSIAFAKLSFAGCAKAVLAISNDIPTNIILN